MKRLSLWSVMLFLMTPLASYSQASGFFELKNKMQHGEVTPSINVVASGKVTEKVGWSLYSLTSKKYSEAYAGPTWSPSSWIKLGASFGLEDSAKPFRYAGSTFLGKGRYSLFTVHEGSTTGGSGYWQMTIANFSILEGTKVGFHSETHVGNGPHIEQNIGSRLSAWASAPIEAGKVTGFVGIRFFFN